MNPSYSTTAPPSGVPASSASYPARSSAPTYIRPQQSCSCDTLPCIHWKGQASAGAAVPPQQYYKPVYVAQPQGPLPKPPQQTSTAPPAPTWADGPPWALPATKVWDDLYINAGVLPRVKDGMPARLPHDWTWEHHYSPLERTLLCVAEDNNASQRHVEKELERILGFVVNELSDMKAQLKSLCGAHGGIANDLAGEFNERKVQFQLLQQQQTKTMNTLADIVQLLSGAENGPVPAVSVEDEEKDSPVVANEEKAQETKQNQEEEDVDFADLPPLVDHEGRIAEGPYKGMPPLLNTATGELVYSDEDKVVEPAPKRVRVAGSQVSVRTGVVEQQRASVSAAEEMEWRLVIRSDGTTSRQLVKKAALPPTPFEGGHGLRAAAGGPTGVTEPEKEESEEAGEEEEMEPFEAVNLEDLEDLASSSDASSCTLEGNDDIAPLSDFDGIPRAVAVEEDMEQYVNAPDSTFAVALASSSSSVNFVSPSSPVTADAPAEKIEQVLAEMPLHAGERKKRTRSVFEVFGMEQNEEEEQEEEPEEAAVEQVVDAVEEDQQQEEEDDETRLLRLQLQLLETKLQLAKAMKQRAEGRI